MEVAKLRQKLHEVWDKLPPVFTIRDVVVLLNRAAERPENRTAIRGLLDAMVAEGKLFQSFVLGHRSGRRPLAWSKVSDGQADVLFEQAIWRELGRMPRYFTIAMLLSALGVSRRLSSRVLSVLVRLEDSGKVVSVTERHFRAHAGRYPRIWSCDPAVIASERSFRSAVSRMGNSGLPRPR